MSEITKEDKMRFVSVKSYADMCGVSPHAIYMRITASNKGEINHKEGDEAYLEQTILEQAEGVFIDIKRFPPKKVKRGRKFKTTKTDAK